MKLEHIENRLRHWKRRYAEMDSAYEKFRQLTGAMPDSKLWKPFFDIWTDYTVSVSELIGDKDEWLQWYQYECHMGKRPMKVILKGGQELEVRTLRHLARVIMND